MFYLIAVTVLWAFSFSLIGEFLAGSVDSYFAVLTRIVLATLVFLPFLKPALLNLKQKAILARCCAVRVNVHLFLSRIFVFKRARSVAFHHFHTALRSHFKRRTL